jgi:6-pyruvoyltetrahydropterin/6-carboxytetrahydropterin synthase
MFEVVVQDWFAAAHQLRFESGIVEPLHGHNWKVRVTFRGAKLDGSGLLLDFVALRQKLREMLQPWHDRFLNELAEFEGVSPSAENVAVQIAGGWLRDDRFADFLYCVEVEEAPGCAARYYPRAV